MRFRIRLAAKVSCSTDVFVEADSELEAVELASDQAYEMGIDEWTIGVDGSADVDDVEVVDVFTVGVDDEE